MFITIHGKHLKHIYTVSNTEVIAFKNKQDEQNTKRKIQYVLTQDMKIVTVTVHRKWLGWLLIDSPSYVRVDPPTHTHPHTHIEKDDNIERGRVASVESVPSHLNNLDIRPVYLITKMKN